MGFADELVKNTKSKQQIEAEEKAYQAKLRKAWQTVLPESVEYEVLSILNKCSNAAKEGKRSYSMHLDSPYIAVDFIKIKNAHFTYDYLTGRDAEKYFMDHKASCFNEYKTAIVDRLRKEGLNVKLSNGTLLSLLNENNTYSQIYIKVKW